MDGHKSQIEVIWGHRLLDEGFTSIPNIIIRNYRKLGIEHGEWGLICTLLTYKHDHRDPYPSQDTLAEHLNVSVRQIKKWIESLVAKQLLLVGQRRNTKSKQFGSAVYNFRPLIQATLQLLGEQPLPEPEPSWDIEYRQPSALEVHSVRSVPEVPSDMELQVHPDPAPEVPSGPVPEVPPNITIQKTSLKYNNNTVVSVRSEIEKYLGKSIRSLSKLLPEWMDKYGPEKLIELAHYIGSNPNKWNNIVGTYRTAVTELWDIHSQVAAAKESVQDERYTEFYKLFPDTK